MPDEFDDLAVRLARDLGSMPWPAVGEIRARARRRTVRDVASVALVVAIVALAAGWSVRAGGRSTPVGDGPSTSGTIGPESKTGPTSPAATSAAVGREIPIEALLQPADVGPARHIENEYTWESGTYPTWLFSHDQCPAFAALEITAFREYQFMRIHQVVPDQVERFNTDTVFVEAHRYADHLVASTVVSDIRRVVSACGRYEGGASEASTSQRPAHIRRTLARLDDGFAGDESLLIFDTVESVEDATGTPIGDPLVTTYLVVRVNDLVTVAFRSTDDTAALGSLGPTAASRLCVAATPRC